MSGLAALAVLAALLALQTGGERLAAARAGLEDPVAAVRRNAAATLARDLEAGDVPAALEALRTWPPTPALALRSVLVESGRARSGLLEMASSHAREAPLARALLVEAFVVRAGAVAPFRAETQPGDEERLPLRDRGLKLARTGAADARLTWREVDWTLADAGAWLRPVAFFPAARAPRDVDGADFAAPRARRIAAEGWLDVQLRRRGLKCLRLAVAVWILPVDRLPPTRGEESGPATLREKRELEDEAALFEAALALLCDLPAGDRGLLGGELLLTLGLPCLPAASAGESEEGRAFARGVQWAAALRGLVAAPDPALGMEVEQLAQRVAALTRGSSTREGVPPERPLQERLAQDGARQLFPEPGRDPADWQRQLEGEAATATREQLEAWLDGLVGAAARIALGDPAQLERLNEGFRGLVDVAAGRMEELPLLPGHLRERAKAALAQLASDAPGRGAVETVVQELWLAGRSARPGTALVELPPGRSPP